MRTETHVGLNVKCPFFLGPTLTNKKMAQHFFFSQNTLVSNFSSSFMCAGEGPYRPFRSDVNALKK